MGIGDKFKTLIERVQVTEVAARNLSRHAAEISSRIEKSFVLRDVKNYGSHSRSTAISNYSDLDLFFVLAAEEFKWGDGIKSSATVLNNLRTELSDRYPDSSIGKDGHAIVVNFSDGSKIDVLPAKFVGINDYKKATLWIPDGSGGWLATSPDAHNSEIKKVHASSGYKFSYAVQLMKFWRDNRSVPVPISSFHMELLFATKGTFSNIKSYAQCVRDAFAEMHSRRLAALTDPLGISGWVPAAHTAAKLESARTAVAFALDKADRALLAEAQGDLMSAKRYWDMVFNGGFPA